MCEEYADRIESGEVVDGEEVEEEEEDPEQLKATEQLIDLLRRHDVGTLGGLIERYKRRK
jgi:hypothetical protein